jgi:hypothetical protein
MPFSARHGLSFEVMPLGESLSGLFGREITARVHAETTENRLAEVSGDVGGADFEILFITAAQ